MPDKLGGEFNIKQVDETSAHILTKIHEVCFPRYWNREAFTDFFSIKNTFAFIIEKEAVPVAMMVYRVSFEQAEILTIAVLPEFRKQGIAKVLLEKIIDSCKSLAANKLFLEVEVGNEPAIKLYENFGFKHIARRKLYYQQLDGSLTDALVMEKKL